MKNIHIVMGRPRSFPWTGQRSHDGSVCPIITYVRRDTAISTVPIIFILDFRPLGPVPPQSTDPTNLCDTLRSSRQGRSSRVPVLEAQRAQIGDLQVVKLPAAWSLGDVVKQGTWIALAAVRRYTRSGRAEWADDRACCEELARMSNGHREICSITPAPSPWA